MIKFIKNLFTKKAPQYNIPIEHNTLMFWIDENNQCYIKAFITNTDKQNSYAFGNMIYDINTGKYMAPVLDVLVDMSSQDNTINKSIQNIIRAWQDSCEDYIDSTLEDEDNPQIRPTFFNKQSLN